MFLKIFVFLTIGQAYPRIIVKIPQAQLLLSTLFYN